MITSWSTSSLKIKWKKKCALIGTEESWEGYKKSLHTLEIAKHIYLDPQKGSFLKVICVLIYS